jgi:hypothetical protein
MSDKLQFVDGNDKLKLVGHFRLCNNETFSSRAFLAFWPRDW